jgi:hypothetical protein
MQLLAKASLYVRPTRKDSYGLAVADAAALGTPVAASDICPRDPRARLFPTGSKMGFWEAAQACLSDDLQPVRPAIPPPEDAYRSILRAYERARRGELVGSRQAA